MESLNTNTNNFEELNFVKNLNNEKSEIVVKFYNKNDFLNCSIEFLDNFLKENNTILKKKTFIVNNNTFVYVNNNKDYSYNKDNFLSIFRNVICVIDEGNYKMLNYTYNSI